MPLLAAAPWCVIVVSYGAGVCRYGRFPAERVSRLGGTVILGEKLTSATYRAIARLVRLLAHVGIMARTHTWIVALIGNIAVVARRAATSRAPRERTSRAPRERTSRALRDRTRARTTSSAGTEAREPANHPRSRDAVATSTAISCDAPLP